jgi:hypothetical protein
MPIWHLISIDTQSHGEIQAQPDSADMLDSGPEKPPSSTLEASFFAVTILLCL